MRTLAVIYSNCSGQLRQNDLTSSYSLLFLNRSFSFGPKELRLFFKSIKQIDLSLLFHETADCETILIPELDLFMAVSIMEVIYLKDLVNGSICMMELNQILTETVSSPF